MRKILIAIVLFTGSAHATSRPSVDFAKLAKTCETSWNAYNVQLQDLFAKSEAYLRDLDQDQVETMYDADDKLIVFISATWPELLEGKYGAWQSFQDVRKDHWTVLKDKLPDRSAHASERKEAVDNFRASVLARYYPEKVISPLDQIIRCYEKQAQVFKD